MGRANIVIANNDFSSVEQYFVNTFDKIILDAPCSGSGMFRKEDKMLIDWSIAKVYKNAEIQKKRWTKIYQASGNNKNSRIVIVIQDKVEFKSKSIKQDKERQLLKLIIHKSR